ncbi:bifunctional methylenetetrahydrofolate dehydrogenase/methenyltetrahydrofolate cyclohydrolase FolD [Macrococcoides bohemicum]|uniref:Bifunctional protein FolD n=1 Tax=Macrococcoides bohemicum TaxID=1903056 RepID=A0AAE7Q2G6_9STAP|nr:bifunctional methylenetetrahydrofolate dehydrogenase/methenyltetrahydrofolate cyclohydrolase FolD [Macrococcus bohemicus]MBC9874248.1 bifunctional methylenetetrahydrofolate dehydrogenase/methenyltetrahydrofolate cyclohydrolase FolD [Macrococcus bohemicus]QRN49502.1 bifunctional methylenetetrahydrofolate dehydrogenase/methenyltetrahydrofolate cyclohydrolase FolD [Macrococcus bohemicus]QYA43244.1 bifunctional methylenetetrahydrofolate dehydrogenase/methenyltetrahydrofolate cyclohydrolase FolD [
MTAKVLDGKQIAVDYRAGLAEEVEALKAQGVTPNLTVILVGNDGASQSYVNNKKKSAEKIGMSSDIIHLDETTTEETLLNEIEKLNNDANVHGILVQVPLPKQIDETKVLEKIAPEKDVDGFNPINIGRLYAGVETYIPCTPLGIMEILKNADMDLEGKDVAVIGRSHIVGQPVSKLLTDANATVTLLHSRSKNMKEVLKRSDVIVSAVGKPGLVTKEDVKLGAVVVDVGNTVVDGKLTGDVKYDEVSEVASAITPVPGGVGPLTITMVLNNTLLAAKRSMK